MPAINSRVQSLERSGKDNYGYNGRLAAVRNMSKMKSA